MGNDCEQVVAPSRDSSPRLVNGRRARDRRAGHPRSGHVKVGVTSNGVCVVCGHLLDSLSAWDHSDTLLKPVNKRTLDDFMGLCFFGRICLRQKEGVTRIR